MKERESGKVFIFNIKLIWTYLKQKKNEAGLIRLAVDAVRCSSEPRRPFKTDHTFL